MVPFVQYQNKLQQGFSTVINKSKTDEVVITSVNVF